MEFMIRQYQPDDFEALITICNTIIDDGNSFPWDTPFGEKDGKAMLAAQTYTGVAAAQDGSIVGFYVLHPNGIGRSSHIANASYGVGNHFRGHGIGQALVEDSLLEAAARGFIAMQFNAVVSSNTAAVRLYEKLGFVRVGGIPYGFASKNGGYTDTIIFYKSLKGR